MYLRRRVVESHSDYLSTPTPCGRHWLAVQPRVASFRFASSHSLSPPPRPSRKRFRRFSLSCCVLPSQVFSLACFFFYNRTIHLLYYITRKSWSQNFLLQPRPVPSPRQTTKKGGDLRPPFLSLAYGIGIQLTNVLSSSAEQKGCMGLTLSRNGCGRRGGNISRIP